MATTTEEVKVKSVRITTERNCSSCKYHTTIYPREPCGDCRQPDVSEDREPSEWEPAWNYRVSTDGA